MNINQIEDLSFQSIPKKQFSLYDIPGQGYFKTKIVENLPYSVCILVFVDSNDKFFNKKGSHSPNAQSTYMKFSMQRIITQILRSLSSATSKMFTLQEAEKL